MKHIIKHKLALFFILFSLILAWSFEQPKSSSKPQENPPSLDVFIPKGFVLIPIEVQNHESLDQVLGQYGVVDLYTAPLMPGAFAKIVVKAIKIVRSRVNSNYFAVLAPENQSAILMNTRGPYKVVIQNPKNYGTNFVKSPIKRKRKLFVEKQE